MANAAGALREQEGREGGDDGEAEIAGHVQIFLHF
jgi:hypothetical protein